MLAVQPLDRLGSEERMPNKSLLWRSVLEVLLNNSSSKIENRNVGRIAAKCDNFLQYVRNRLGDGIIETEKLVLNHARTGDHDQPSTLLGSGSN